jgi:hypothetical protein
VDDLDFLVKILIVIMEELGRLGFEIEGNFDLLGDNSQTILFSKNAMR